MKELEGNPYREKSRKLLFCNTSTAICNTSIGEYSEVTPSIFLIIKQDFEIETNKK